MLFLVCVHNEVRETVREISARTIFPRRPAFRVFSNGLYSAFDFGLEIEPEASGSFFVVCDSLPKLYFRFSEDRDVYHEYFALISANTSAAGRPLAVPSRTILSRR